MKRTAHVDVERELAVLERAAAAGLLDPSQREEAEKVFRRVLDLGVPMSMLDVLTQRGFVARADMDRLSPSDPSAAGRPPPGGTDQAMDGPEALQVATLAMKAGFLPPGDLGDLLKKEAQSSTPLSVLLTRDKGLLPACIETLRAVARGEEGTPLSGCDLDLLGRIVAAGGSPLKAQAALSAVHILWRDARFSLSLPDALFKKEVIEPETLDDVMSGMGFGEGKLAGYRGRISSEDVAEDRLRMVAEIRRIADGAGVALAVDEVLFLLGEVPSSRAPTAGRKRRPRPTPVERQARKSRSRAAAIGLGAATLLAGGLLVFVAWKLLGPAPESDGPDVVTPGPRIETVEIPGAEDSARLNVEWRFAQVEKFARKNPTRTAEILQRYRFLELKYQGTADGDTARQEIEAFLSRREKEASDEARTRIERSRSLAAAGDFEEARIALSAFPRHLEGTSAEAAIEEALEEMDRMEETLALESRRREDARREAREREGGIVRARNEEARRAKEERRRTADAIGMAQGMVMNFSYEKAIRSLEKFRDRSRSRWAAAECQKALDRAQAQKATFDSLLDLLGRGGEMPNVDFASGSKLRVTAADGTGVSAANEQMTLKKPWHRIVAADFASILEWAGAGWTDPYEIATFSYDHGAPEWGDEVLRGVAEGDAAGVSGWLARRRGVDVPEGGFVLYQGEWIPKIEAEHLALGEVLFQSRWWPRDELQAELKTARRDRNKKRIRKKAMEEAAAVAKVLLDKEGIAAIEKMVENGDISRRVDISIVSDGFTQEEAGTVKRLADLVIKGIQNADPFRNYEKYINFNLVRLVEEESGINELPDKPRTTKVGATLQNNILTCDVAAAWKYGRKAPDCDLVIVVANVAGGRATGGGGVITLNNSGSVGDVVIHELGHAYGGLDDEYVDAGIAPGRNYGPNAEAGHINTTRESNPKKVKWHYWNFPPAEGSPVGCFEGAYYHDKDYYRPSRECRMRSSGTPKYCAVCQEQMERRFYDQLEPLEGAWPAKREVIIWADQKLRLEIEGITITKHEDEKPYGKFTNNWYVDGVRTNKDVSDKKFSRNYLDIEPDSLAPGRHEVIVNVDFKNDRIRRDHGNLSSTRVWSIVVSPYPEPEIAAPAKVRGKYRRAIAFQVKKRNVPAEGPFRFEARRLPRGATFDPESGLFRWIPDRYQKGLFRIEFVIDDGALSVSRFTDLQVRGGARNSGPVLKYLLPPVGVEGEELTFQVEAIDIDGDHLTYWSPNLPDGATLDPETGVFLWRPGLLQADTYKGIQLFVGDAERVDQQEVTIQIKDRPIGTDVESYTNFEIILALRSPNSGIRSVALDEAKKRLGQTFLLHEYARWMRFKNRDQSLEALEALKELLVYQTGGWRREQLVRFLLAVEPYCRQYVESPEVLEFLNEAARAGAELDGLDKWTRGKIRTVLMELEEIRKYNEERLRETEEDASPRTREPRTGRGRMGIVPSSRRETWTREGGRHGEGLCDVLDGVRQGGERQEPASRESQDPERRSHDRRPGHHRCRGRGLCRGNPQHDRRTATRDRRGDQDHDQPGPRMNRRMDPG